VRDDPKFDDYFDEATRGILQDVHRIASIASDFARFARLPPPKPAPVDVAEVACTTVAMHSSDALPIDLRAAPCPTVQADRDQLAQMLTNLLQNAMDATQAHTQSPRVIVSVEPHGDDHVCITVSDNGPGVSEELLPRLFAPYVTTKVHGTGLGLPIVQRIVVEHGGEIRYAPAPQGGASFSVVLPLSGPVPPPESHDPAKSPEPALR
jgi:C4-dicarboxylate-specific signal transduction histidine kinase